MLLRNVYDVVVGLHTDGEKIDRSKIAKLVNECSKIKDKEAATGVITTWCIEDKILN
jgi:replicative DNA helicase